jgi:hypothetical protein
MATAAERKLMGEVMDFLEKNRLKNHYRQLRPMANRDIANFTELKVRVLSPAGIYWDCSESTEEICRIGGLANPSGFSWASGAGNTQTMYDHLPRYSKATSAELGALCFFGIPGELGTQHITIVRHPGPDPVLFSHGGSGQFAAHFVPLSVERQYHMGTPTFLSIAKL